MKRIVKSILITGALTVGAAGLMATTPGENWVDQLNKAKIGRAPIAEAHAPAEGTAVTRAAPAVMPANNWFETFFRAKLGRLTPAENARIRAERETTPFREETVAGTPANTWLNDLWNAKYGRPFPK